MLFLFLAGLQAYFWLYSQRSNGVPGIEHTSGTYKESTLPAILFLDPQMFFLKWQYYSRYLVLFFPIAALCCLHFVVFTVMLAKGCACSAVLKACSGCSSDGNPFPGHSAHKYLTVVLASTLLHTSDRLQIAMTLGATSAQVGTIWYWTLLQYCVEEIRHWTISQIQWFIETIVVKEHIGIYYYHHSVFIK